MPIRMPATTRLVTTECESRRGVCKDTSRVELEASQADAHSNAARLVSVAADSVPAKQNPVRQFGVFNPQLDEMVEWLKQCRVRTATME